MTWQPWPGHPLSSGEDDTFDGRIQGMKELPITFQRQRGYLFLMQSSYLRTIWLVMPGVLKIQIKYSNMSWQLWSQLRNGQQYQAIQPNSRQKAPFNFLLVMVFGIWIKNKLKVRARGRKISFIHIQQCYKLQYRPVLGRIIQTIRLFE